MAVFRVVALVMVTSMVAAAPVTAATASVRVTKAMDDKAIITRRSGESYLIEKGVGCLSLWRYEGKTVLIVSPGLFLGVGSKLLIPEVDQECRIWDSKLLSGSSVPPPDVRPSMSSPAPPVPTQPGTTNSNGVVIVQKGLRLVGYDPGPADGEMGARTASALKKYSGSKGNALTEDGLRKTLMALALDVVTKNPNSEDALQVSLGLMALLSDPAAAPGSSRVPPQAPSRSDCEDGHWISTVSSGGEIVKLEDGSIWEISAIDRIDTMLWLVTEEITICGGRLINTDTGDAVDATRIK